MALRSLLVVTAAWVSGALDTAPVSVELSNPMGVTGPVEPAAQDYRSNASTLVQPMPLQGLGNAVEGLLTLATD